jgi:hypothetical protein
VYGSVPDGCAIGASGMTHVTSYANRGPMRPEHARSAARHHSVAKQEGSVYRIIVCPPRTSDSHSPDGTTTKVADVELCFDGPLAGLTLAGFAIWRNGDAGLRVSFPARRYVNGSGQRRSFLLVRATDTRDRTTYDRIRDEILAAYDASVHAATASAVGALS